ncbi:putative quinol monooxygenase [Paracidobacterium acidisoli]|uniref:Antibiotic biosynthesis monooxygenase n=1 Tax=Paracidobacterium acidisoli TaxID=2303751 RepID=A0A372ILJ6_9BACT|nr:antibiotic biosynthesis monooxygenase [Paracidobacterium acidisoli]MBT9332228.1 antibiotic biosynthesis monooxygenase [Paracidobacterium acidisoli]
MVHLALSVRLEAKPGKEEEAAAFLSGALPLAQAEQGTVVWFALRLGPSTFAIFDAFADEPARQAHLSGQIAAALMKKAPELFSNTIQIEKADILAAKLS